MITIATPTTPRWKVVYDHQWYAVYVLIHDDARQDEGRDEFDKIMAWAKRAPSLVGLGDSPFMVVEVPNGQISGGKGWDAEWDLRGIIPMQGSGGPNPKPEQWARIKAWRAEHRAEGEAMGIYFEEKSPKVEATRSLGWVRALMKRHNIYC